MDNKKIEPIKASQEKVLTFLEAQRDDDILKLGKDKFNRYIAAADPDTEDFVTEDDLLDDTLTGLENMSDDELRERLRDESYASKIDELLKIGTETPESKYGIDNNFEVPELDGVDDEEFGLNEDIVSTNFSPIQTERRAAAIRGQENPISFATKQINELLDNETFMAGIDAINEFRSGTLKGAQNLGATLDEVSQNLANYIFDADIKPKIERAELNTNIEKAGAAAIGLATGAVGKGAVGMAAAGSGISAAMGNSLEDTASAGAISAIGGPLGKMAGNAVKNINPLAAGMTASGITYSATGSAGASLAAGGAAAAIAPKLAKLARPLELVTKALALAIPQIDFARDNTTKTVSTIKLILNKLLLDDRKQLDTPKNELRK